MWDQQQHGGPNQYQGMNMQLFSGIWIIVTYFIEIFSSDRLLIFSNDFPAGVTMSL